MKITHELVAFGQANLMTGELTDKVLLKDTAVYFSSYINDTILTMAFYHLRQGEALRTELQELYSFEDLLIYINPVEVKLINQHSYMEFCSNKKCYKADTWQIFRHGGCAD